MYAEHFVTKKVFKEMIESSYDKERIKLRCNKYYYYLLCDGKKIANGILLYAATATTKYKIWSADS